MTYDEAISYIHGISKFGIKLGLDNSKKLLELMGNPDKKYKIIHVAGTNGKGSTCAFIDSMLRCAGFKTGLYTSPFLEVFNERIRINGENIPDDDLIYMVEYIQKIIKKLINLGYTHPTEFEVITAIALKYYEIKKVDFVVLEVGMGGRFDATNAVSCTNVSVITTIDFDHMKILGDTLPKIAFEKAGIIRESGVVISYPQKNEVHEVIKNKCKEMNAELLEINKEDITNIKMNDNGEAFDYKYIKDIHIRLLGMHQVKNAVTAIEAVLALKKYGIEISLENIKKGVYMAVWPGRMEVLGTDPRFIIDGAHNPQGAKVISDNIKKLFNYRKLIIGIGILKDKDVDKYLKNLLPLADCIIITRPDSSRALSAEDLSKKIKGLVKCETMVEEDVKKAIQKSLAAATNEDLILFCGSLYLIGHVRQIYNQIKNKI